MTYLLRLDGPGRLQHVTARVNWCAYYIHDEATKAYLAGVILEAAARFDVDVLAGVLMSNHLHMVVRSPAEDRYRELTCRRTACRHMRPWPRGHQKATVISQFMRHIRQRLTKWRQDELGVTGRFWEGRYDSRGIDHATSLAVRIAYDHRNPVKAGLTMTPEDYRWSTASFWSQGILGPFPVRIVQPLPFGLTLDDLSRRVASLQGTAGLDDHGDLLRPILRSRAPRSESEWLAALSELGVSPP